MSLLTIKFWKHIYWGDFRYIECRWANCPGLSRTQGFLGWNKLVPLLVIQASWCTAVVRGASAAIFIDKRIHTRVGIHMVCPKSLQPVGTKLEYELRSDSQGLALPEPSGKPRYCNLVEKDGHPWVLKYKRTPQTFYFSGEFSLFCLMKWIRLFFSGLK